MNNSPSKRKSYIAPSTLYLSIANNVITGIIEKHDEEKARFEYDLSNKQQAECILNFCYYYGKYAPFNVAGQNNTRLHDQMLSFFTRDENQFNEFFNPPLEKFNVRYDYVSQSFNQCELVRDKLKKVENIYFMDSKLEFGKYKGKAIRQIINIDPQYIKYLLKTGKRFHGSVLNIFN